MKRADDFNSRRKDLAELNDDQLYQKFWALAEEIVQPMLELGYQNTTPSIERSILLRMGLSSLEAAPIVNGVIKKGLMGKGCGHIVWRLSQKLGISIRETGSALANGQYWDVVDDLFIKPDC